MIPNIDPRALKSMMDRLGIKSEEIKAVKVTIELPDKMLVIDNPEVVSVEMQGKQMFQVGGEVREVEKQVSIEISEEDVRLVMEKSGISDEEKARKALQESNGNIAEAILRLKSGS